MGTTWCSCSLIRLTQRSEILISSFSVNCSHNHYFCIMNFKHVKSVSPHESSGCQSMATIIKHKLHERVSLGILRGERKKMIKNKREYRRIHQQKCLHQNDHFTQHNTWFSFSIILHHQTIIILNLRSSLKSSVFNPVFQMNCLFSCVMTSQKVIFN